MAADLSQNAVLRFLQSNGGSVRNADLLLHFRSFIRDSADRDRNRELFKKFVNSVASVRQTDGVSYVILKKQFKGNVPGGGEAGSSNLVQAPSTDKSRLKQPVEGAGKPAPPGQTVRKTILPAAGIMVVNNNNNNVETHLSLKPQAPQSNVSPEGTGRGAAAQGRSHISDHTELRTPSLSEPPVRDQRSKGGQQKVGFGPLPGITPVTRIVGHHGVTGQQVPVLQALHGREACLQPEGGLHQEPPLQAEVVSRRIRYRPSYKSAVSCDEDDEEEEEEEEQVPAKQISGDAAWPQSSPLRDAVRATSTSSSCTTDPPAPPSVVSSSSSSSSERTIPKICIQDVEGEMLVPRGPGWSFESGLEVTSPSVELTSTRHSPPLKGEVYTPSPHSRPQSSGHQDNRYSHPADIQLETPQRLHKDQRTPLLSSHSSSFSPSSDAGFSSSDWPSSGSSRASGWNSSFEELQARAGDTAIQEALQRTQRTRLEAVTHLGNSTTMASPWYHSTGNLCDDQGSTARGMPSYLSNDDFFDNHEAVESSEGSTSSPVLRQRPALAGQLSPQVRSRMCRSMGADLDQILQEEGRDVGGGGGGSDAARLNRLHLISSSLSLRPSRQSLVPLDPREHAWLVKGAAGAWTEIYSLFREDSSLLNKQDFISGFTVLHWIAKHGDHRVLNTLWYGVQKVGMTFNINARSTCGHTPLHIAAMHGNKNVIRLLVKNFGADVKQRDMSGKRPWQYLSSSTSLEIFEMLGAPARNVLKGVGTVQPGWDQQPQQRRRRRHQMSSASSGVRPLTIAGTTKVKRSTSLAAFLKHKSLNAFSGLQSDSSI
ncbi:hypothetical protein Q5P01_024386 [Channa striata]|uniref:SOWAHA-C winged helix-turn-helix domain-containing protein n=1 Tax=Channa striata TaxID=64152 RepID=A0AA88J441_CHASR|nr:hypothetical protein Q5P01_024386 [Channa striata]